METQSQTFFKLTFAVERDARRAMFSLGDLGMANSNLKSESDGTTHLTVFGFYTEAEAVVRESFLRERYAGIVSSISRPVEPPLRKAVPTPA